MCNDGKSLSKLFLVLIASATNLSPATAGSGFNALPTLGKGQQSENLPKHISPTGKKLQQDLSKGKSVYAISNEADLRRAMMDASPGQIILISPGTYQINHALTTSSGGNPERPITLRASKPGEVLLNINAVVGFEVTQPYWSFENLTIRGVCNNDSYCEHAFHITGKASRTVIRNNYIEDFNAHIKINGDPNSSERWPDSGLIQYNTLTNSRPRYTANPVTPIDLVGSSKWVISDNIVSNFIKTGGSQVSFGIFMKGAGRSGRIERNLIVCTDNHHSQPGSRVGLSFGGGGSFPAAICRDQQCNSEHSNGIIANNVVAHCNDVAIYINKATQTVVAHNTLIDTNGIDLRFPATSAVVHGNLMEGRIKPRDDARLESEKNLIGSVKAYFKNPDQLQLQWINLPEKITTHPAVTDDFCGRTRPLRSLPGAFTEFDPCTTKIVHGESG